VLDALAGMRTIIHDRPISTLINAKLLSHFTNSQHHLPQELHMSLVSLMKVGEALPVFWNHYEVHFSHRIDIVEGNTMLIFVYDVSWMLFGNYLVEDCFYLWTLYGLLSASLVFDFKANWWIDLLVFNVDGRGVDEGDATHLLNTIPFMYMAKDMVLWFDSIQYLISYILASISPVTVQGLIVKRVEDVLGRRVTDENVSVGRNL